MSDDRVIARGRDFTNLARVASVIIALSLCACAIGLFIFLSGGVLYLARPEEVENNIAGGRESAPLWSAPLWMFRAAALTDIVLFWAFVLGLMVAAAKSLWPRRVGD